MVSQEELKALRKELAEAKEEKRKRDIKRENIEEIKGLGKKSAEEARQLRSEIFRTRQSERIRIAKKIGRGFQATGRGFKRAGKIAVRAGRTTKGLVREFEAAERKRKGRIRRSLPKAQRKRTTFRQDIDFILRA